MRPIDADALMAKVQEWLNYVSAQTVEVGETDCETVCDPDPYYVGEENVLNMVMRTLRGMPTVDDWISVKDRLPEIGKEVLVLIPVQDVLVPESFGTFRQGGNAGKHCQPDGGFSWHD